MKLLTPLENPLRLSKINQKLRYQLSGLRLNFGYSQGFTRRCNTNKDRLDMYHVLVLLNDIVD